jgi:spermidine synthase
MSENAKEINGIIYCTLRNVFRQIAVIQGERNYYLASDSKLHLDIARGIQNAGIQNEYVQPGFIDDEILKQRNLQITAELSGVSYRVNRDLLPVAYFHQIHYWLSILEGKGGIILVLLILVFFVWLLIRKISPAGTGIFAAGFAGSSAVFLIILAYQILYGYVYQMMGIIIGFYMSGLTAGAIYGGRSGKKISIRMYIILQIILLQLIVFLPFLISFLSRYSGFPLWTGQALLFIITGMIALVTGLEFNMASQLERQKIEYIAGSLYSVDLAGAASGTLIVSLVCFPVIGLFNTCLIIVVLILTGIVVNLLSVKKYS